jgi:hypothetical protein
MAVIACGNTDVNLLVGDRWLMRVVVTDDDGNRTAATVVFTVTLPGGTTATPTVTTPETGVYETAYSPATVGRFVAQAVAAGFGQASFSAYVQTITTAAQMPTLADVKDYLETAGEPVSHDDDQITDALNTELAAQRAVCRVGAVYPYDLRQAVLRRTARNLAMRMFPMALTPGDSDQAARVLPGRDPEVRRLEGPYRKMPIG